MGSKRPKRPIVLDGYEHKQIKKFIKTWLAQKKDPVDAG